MLGFNYFDYADIWFNYSMPYSSILNWSQLNVGWVAGFPSVLNSFDFKIQRESWGRLLRVAKRVKMDEHNWKKDDKGWTRTNKEDMIVWSVPTVAISVCNHMAIIDYHFISMHLESGECSQNLTGSFGRFLYFVFQPQNYEFTSHPTHRRHSIGIAYVSILWDYP